MPLTRLVNGETVTLTAAEESAHLAESSAADARRAAETAAEQAEQSLIDSQIAELLASLGNADRTRLLQPQKQRLANAVMARQLLKLQGAPASTVAQVDAAIASFLTP